jgi:hypothetical protein
MKNDDLRAEPDDLHDLHDHDLHDRADRLDLHGRDRPLGRDDFDRQPRRLSGKPRSVNWLAYQIALGIILGGCTLWVLGAVAEFVVAKFVLSQIQVSFPGFGRS